jgi:hypothetical protein
MNDDYKDTTDSVAAAAYCFAGMLVMAVVGYVVMVVRSVL